jgi:2-polyprenyl-3-methyl-5-hydroxy-6-metoxy-1,4-benzoquinol methylase
LDKKKTKESQYQRLLTKKEIKRVSELGLMMNCRLCETNNVELMINFGNQPIANNLKNTANTISESYPFELGYCKKCGFIQIITPIDPQILYQNYFTISSWKNQPQVHRLIEVLNSLHGINSKSDILDIGCNDGSFLDILRKMNFSNLHGIEPTTDSFELAKKKGLNVTKSFFSSDNAKRIYGDKKFDLIITRHVLEHILDLNDFISATKNVLNDDGLLVIELPDSQLNLEYMDYGLWEEHINYFTYPTLKRLLNKHGFQIIHHESTLFSGRAMMLFCKKINNVKKVSNASLSEIDDIILYKRNWKIFNENLIKYFENIKKPIAIYGCGARSINFINLTNSAKYITCFIDDQKEKQNLIVPCDNNLVVEKWDTQKYKEFYFLLGVNTENETKVINNRGLKKQGYHSILPPSKILPKFWDDLIFNLESKN